VNKFVLVVTVLALLLALSVPAMAADVTGSGSVVLGGDGSQQCVPGISFGNVGKGDRNKQPFTQEYSTADDLSGTGGTFSLTPTETGPCTQQVQESSGGSS
jgi:hypothetical protein